jgi:hypothetical protein
MLFQPVLWHNQGNHLSTKSGIKTGFVLCICIHENQQRHQLLFNLLVMYGDSYMFQHYVAILS